MRWPGPPPLLLPAAAAAAMASLGPHGVLGAPPARGSLPPGRGLLPPPYAVVLISCSGLVAFVLLLLTCLCCKRGDVGFKEFENPEGEEDSGEFTPPAEETSSSPSLPDVYVLPLGEVGGPTPPPPPTDPSKPPSLSRQHLSYLQEIGTGWFGKVILGELLGDASPAQVVVKELRAGAGAPEQRRFLDEAQPYRSLQHPNLLQCLGLCGESGPLLLVMEYCQLGDLKRYLRAQRGAGGGTPELPPRDVATLQRLALEVTLGLRHLHRHGYVHSDLALRNCLLTSELTVRLGDYGLAHSNYREDYYVTPERLWVPLRWVAPELLAETQGTLAVAEQSKESNVWSLGVTLWELFELGVQPYQHLSDQELLGRLMRRRPLALGRPRLRLPHADSWFGVLQSCWRPPPQRPSLEELHRRLSTLLRGPQGGSPAPPPPPRPPSAFPLLDTFPGPDPEDVLTVTQSSRGRLAFECLWERARGGRSGGGPPPQNRPSTLGTPGVLPVLGARSPSGTSEYYIRLEEHEGGGDAGEAMAPPAVPSRRGGLNPFRGVQETALMGGAGEGWGERSSAGSTAGSGGSSPRRPLACPLCRGDEEGEDGDTPPPPCTCALARADVVRGWRERGAPLRPRCDSAGDDSSLRAERGSLVECPAATEATEATETAGHPGLWGAEGQGAAVGQDEVALGATAGTRDIPFGIGDGPVGPRKVFVDAREATTDKRGGTWFTRDIPFGTTGGPSGTREATIDARDIPFGIGDGLVGTTKVFVDAREATIDKRGGTWDTRDTPFGIGCGPMGTTEVFVDSREATVGTRDVPFGTGDGSMGPRETTADQTGGTWGTRDIPFGIGGGLMGTRHVIVDTREATVDARDVPFSTGDGPVGPREATIDQRGGTWDTIPFSTPDGPVGTRNVTFDTRNSAWDTRDVPSGTRDAPMGTRKATADGRGGTFGIREVPFGTGDVPVGTRNVFERRGSAQHTRDIPFGSRDGLMGSRDGTFGTRDVPFGSRDIPMGTRDGTYTRDVTQGTRVIPLGIRNVTFGTRDSAWGTWDIPSDTRGVPMDPRDVTYPTRDGTWGTRDIPFVTRDAAFITRDAPLDRHDSARGTRDLPVVTLDRWRIFPGGVLGDPHQGLPSQAPASSWPWLCHRWPHWPRVPRRRWPWYPGFSGTPPRSSPGQAGTPKVAAQGGAQGGAKGHPQRGLQRCPQRDPQRGAKGCPQRCPQRDPQRCAKGCPQRCPQRGPQQGLQRGAKRSPQRDVKRCPCQGPQRGAKRHPQGCPPPNCPMTSSRQCPEGDTKRCPRRSPEKCPKRSPKGSLRRCPEMSPKASLEKVPKGSPRRCSKSPTGSPARSPKGSPGKGPPRSPKASPRRCQERASRGSPRRLQEMSPKRCQEMTPKAAPKRCQEMSPRRRQEMSSRGSPRRLQEMSPKASPRRCQEMMTPKASPKKCQEISPQGPQRRSPRGSPAKLPGGPSPKEPPKVSPAPRVSPPSPGQRPGDSGYETETSPSPAAGAGGSGTTKVAVTPGTQVSHRGQGDRDGDVPGATAEGGFVVQVCQEQLQVTLREDVTRNLLAPRGQDEHPEALAQGGASRGRVGDNGHGGGATDVPVPTPTPSSADIRAKASRLSLPLPPLALRPFPRRGPRAPRWEAAEARGPPEEEEEEEEEDEEEEEEAEAEGAEAAGGGGAAEPAVPVVVTRWDGRGLRGLLKSPRAAAEAEAALARKRKMVSFFDDVTIYLFDQETPTNELSCQSAAEREGAEPDAFAPPDGVVKPSKTIKHHWPGLGGRGNKRASSCGASHTRVHRGLPGAARAPRPTPLALHTRVPPPCHPTRSSW
ncbi:LOW QUALITY PROTEIN: serine/threonine-protein kinase LMTK3-like [Falco biarmicus]|uniref:LOW QUALITY PROTEIN: serine/threonine-protein kinase LMTK3-like n=1 Tax=Falco biarmicus TaxID=345155 RepID=UPI0024BCCAD5|nr:LOW QUALITY PROTEIN: serine/threonine-protein kinase LMTK3-like [Falco biarmicus]